MIESAFYHNTTRIYTAAFGSLFNGIRIERENKAGDVIGVIPVPLMYSNKEKFIRRMKELSSISPEETRIKETLPAMGFELLNMIYSPTRKTNTMERIAEEGESGPRFMFNRVPYDFNFVLYIAARRTDDALRIVEQILPYFTPELNVRVRDMRNFPSMINDIPIVLDDISPQITVEGGFDDRRLIEWQLTFTMKGYLYTNVRDRSVIKKSQIDLSHLDLNTFYEGYLSQVDPLGASALDEHTIVEEITDAQVDSQTVMAGGGATLTTTLD